MRAVIGAIIVLAGAVLLAGGANADSAKEFAIPIGVLGVVYTLFGWAAVFWRDSKAT
jgi:hypothetical protein